MPKALLCTQPHIVNTRLCFPGDQSPWGKMEGQWWCVLLPSRWMRVRIMIDCSAGKWHEGPQVLCCLIHCCLAALYTLYLLTDMSLARKKTDTVIDSIVDVISSWADYEFTLASLAWFLNGLDHIWLVESSLWLLGTIPRRRETCGVSQGSILGPIFF